jgi:hypothetical protein
MELEEKRAKLEKELGVNVHSYQVTTDKWGVLSAFFKEPTRTVKKMALEKAATLGITVAGDFLIETSLILEETDPRFVSESSEFDALNIGLNLFAQSLVTVILGDQKKN